METKELDMIKRESISSASIANELGISIYDIGKMLGYSRVETTEIYTHSFDKIHKKNIDKIAKSISKNSES